MGTKTGIAWTDKTFNPWWGCSKVSPGCANCYAETFSKRAGFDVWGPEADRRFFGEKHWAEPLKWNAEALEQGVRFRVFCASMADWAEDARDLDPWREKLFKLIEDTPNLDWQLLTKRPELAVQLTPDRWKKAWPANAWAMTSVENQAMANKRIPHLIKIPARIRGLSIEPQLEKVVIGLLGTAPEDWDVGYTPIHELIHWVIVGGESGPGRRPFDPTWAEYLRNECLSTGTAFFMKQDGAFKPGEQGRISDALFSVKEFPQ